MTEWIKLNVGGQTFLTTKLTLLSEPDSMLAKMFSGELDPGPKDDQGAYMIDGTPMYFEPILHYLRRRKLVINPNISKDGVLDEARYFGIQSLVDQIEKIPEARRVTPVHELNGVFDFQDKVIQKLLNTKGTSAVICDHDGNIWAKSANFGVTSEELRSLIGKYADTSLLAQSGVTVAGKNYMYLSSTDKVIRAEKRDYGSDCRVHAFKTTQNYIVCVYYNHFSESAFQMEKLADYLIQVGF